MKIRTLVLAGALALPGLAIAQTGSSQTQKQEKKQEKSAEKQAKKGEHTAAYFENKENFETQGKVERLDTRGKKLTLGREENQLPSFALQIPTDAEIMIDGQKGELSQIQRGSDVRATFNIVDDRPLAVKLDVTSGSHGSHKQGSQQQPSQQY